MGINREGLRDRHPSHADKSRLGRVCTRGIASRQVRLVVSDAARIMVATARATRARHGRVLPNQGHTSRSAAGPKTMLGQRTGRHYGSVSLWLCSLLAWMVASRLSRRRDISSTAMRQ